MQISVVMPAYNAEKYIAEAMDSVLNQSFTDFEFIIVDDGSTDSTLSIIKSYNDSRIVLIENKHNFINSLNKGMQTSNGKYIARMDTDDIMHVDRLKIQHSIMEEEPQITVCGSRMILFGEGVRLGQVTNSLTGLIESPLHVFLKGNLISHPTVMIRKSFLKKHKLKYADYPYAEDYKLWMEIARLGGIFYVESQPLLRYRISELQVTRQKREEQRDVSFRIRDEICDYLISNVIVGKEILMMLKNNLEQLMELDMIKREDKYTILSSVLVKNKKP